MKFHELNKRLQKIEAERERTASKSERSKNIKEVEEIMENLSAEYNSPEAVAKREARYKEIQRIGKLREQAYLRGEPMSNYPLPWEKID